MRLMTQPGATQWHDSIDRTREQELENEHRVAIENLAYQLWLDRGCPAGSAEIDWFEAERKLVQRLIPSARN